MEHNALSNIQGHCWVFNSGDGSEAGPNKGSRVQWRDTLNGIDHKVTALT